MSNNKEKNKTKYGYYSHERAVRDGYAIYTAPCTELESKQLGHVDGGCIKHVKVTGVEPTPICDDNLMPNDTIFVGQVYNYVCSDEIASRHIKERQIIYQSIRTPDPPKWEDFF